MSNCTSGCRSKDHASFAECLRSKGTRIAYCDSANNRDATAQKAWDKELDSYRAARAEGIQPERTDTRAIEDAKRISDATGTAYQGA